jgi:zinc protease
MSRYLTMLVLAAPIFAQVPPAKRPADPVKPPAPKPAAPSKPVGAPSVNLKYPPLRPLPTPNIVTFTMANGISVYLLEDRDLPTVGGTAFVRTGNLFDPADKVGLATLTGKVMRSGGTKTKSGEQLDQQLENLAASVDTSIGETSATVTFSALKENTAEVLEVFRDVLVGPAFRQDSIDQAKAEMRDLMARRNDNGRAVALREFISIVYGRETPYGWREEHATLNRIGRADLEAFYRRYFFPANLTLGIRGDFVAEEMKAQLQTLFSGWTEKQEVSPAFPKVAAQPAPGIFLAEKADATLTSFWIGHIGSTYNDKDYPALQIATAILGGGSQGRLYERLRNRMGAASEITAQWAAEFGHPGLLRIGGRVRPRMTIESLRAVLDEIELLRGAEISDDELRTAKEAAVNSLVFSSDTRAKMLGNAVNYAYFGYPANFLAELQKGLAAVTKADVRRVLQERISPERFTIVVAGNPAEFGGNLSVLGKPVRAIDLTIAQPKLEVTKIDEASLEKGKQLIAKVQQAVGGVEKLVSIKDLVLTTEFKVSPAAGGIQVSETDQWIAPSYFKQESLIPRQGKIAVYFDGKTGRISTPNGEGPLTGAQLRQVRGDLLRLYVPLLLSDRMEGRTVNAVDDSTIEISDTNGEFARLVLDPASNMPSRVLYETLPSVGSQISVQEVFSDFREVEGIKLPHAITIMQSGQKFADVTVTGFQTNKGLKLTDLQKLR